MGRYDGPERRDEREGISQLIWWMFTGAISVVCFLLWADRMEIKEKMRGYDNLVQIRGERLKELETHYSDLSRRLDRLERSNRTRRSKEEDW